MRKGPDGKDIKPADGASEDATRKVPRRSIRDRLLASPDDDADVPPTQMAPRAEEAARRPPLEPDVGPTVFAPSQRTAPPATTPPATTTLAGAAPPPLPSAPAPRSAEPPRQPVPEADPNVTQIYRPRRDPAAEAKPAAAAPGIDPKYRPATPGDPTIADPVVGWLVVVDGPGRGASLPLGYGNNRIGRAKTENVSIDFGDEQISRENHATVTYDGKHHRFYVQQGASRNLVYVNDEPVMVPLELKGGEDLLLGQTKLRFVPFCGKDFDWFKK
jgi:hypothetical protein